MFDSTALLLAAGLMLTFEPALGEETSPPAEPMRFEFARPRMGVEFRLIFYAADEPAANRAAEAAFARIGELDRCFSDYDPDSEAMRLCRDSGPGRPVAVSDDLQRVLGRALDYSKRTDGAFDVTIGPVVKLWRRARRMKRLPDPDALRTARHSVGQDHVRFDRKAGTVELLRPGMSLDFGGIAKGDAADQALRTLADMGITRAVIDASGDITVGDPPPGETGWRIGIAPLDRPDGRPSRFLRLRNAAVATSGDAFQHIEIDGRRYSHIVDPQTGLGLTQPASVTVIAPTGLAADALASTVSILGPDRGLRLIDETPDTAAFIVRLEGDEPKTYASKRFAANH